MAERIGTTLAGALRKRRNSTGTGTTPAKQPRISTRSPTTTPRRRRSVRISMVASSSVQIAAAAEVSVEGEQATAVVMSDSVASTGGATPVRVATASSKQSTPPTSGKKSAQSSSGSPSSSLSARRRRPSQTLQSVSQSLGKPLSSASKQPAAEKDTNEVEEEPESEPVAPQLSSRQLQFTDSDEETDSDAQPNEASQDSDYVPECADDQSQTGENEENERAEAEPEAAGVALPSGMKPRRRTKFWEHEEEEFLRKGVQKHGLGKWKLILLEGKGVFSNHRTNVDLKDKWKNLLQRTGEPREKRKAPATPAAAEPVEIDISDNEGSTTSPAPPLPAREPKKRRTAAMVASASFAAVRTAELSPSQSQSQKESEKIERYRSPQIDHSYGVEDVVEDSEREKEEHGTLEPKSKASASASRKKETPEPEPEVPEPKPTSKVPEPKATAAVPKIKTPAPKAKVRAAKSKAAASKTATPGSSLEPRTTVSDFVKFEFASDKTFPKKLSMQVNLKQYRTIGMLKDRARKYLLRDIPEDVSVQLLGISSRRLVDDDEDTETCFKEFGHDYYFVY